MGPTLAVAPTTMTTPTYHTHTTIASTVVDPSTRLVTRLHASYSRPYVPRRRSASSLDSPNRNHAGASRVLSAAPTSTAHPPSCTRKNVMLSSFTITPPRQVHSNPTYVNKPMPKPRGHMTPMRDNRAELMSGGTRSVSPSDSTYSDPPSNQVHCLARPCSTNISPKKIR
jgi:hypothetical protein